ncbi:putative ribonuclease H-like domain-containing protein [Tanacetum coccineum]
MELESTNSGPTAKLPILKLGEYEMWKTNKKNDVKARSLLLMALPNEHQLTFSQYPDAKSMFAAFETRFRGNAATKKTQKTLLKQQYENFSATSAESLDSIFNRLQKIVSRLAILGVKFVGGSSGAQNLAFMTAPSTNSTNDTKTASPQVSTASLNVNAASPQVSTASVSDNTVYAFMVENPNGSNVLHRDLEQIHEDDLEVMDLKWQLSLLSVRAKTYYQRTGKKIFINANDIAGYDKSKVECYNCHKLGHFAREYRAPRSKEKEQVQTNMALTAFSDSEGLGYSAVPPPHPSIYNRPNKLDLSYSGLDEFKEPEFKGYGPKDSEQESNVVCDKKN